MKSLLSVIVLLASVAVVHAGDTPAAGEGPFTGPVSDRSRICMMQDSLQPKPGLAHEYQGKKYWLCCQMCVESFTADPERYARATDPVNGAVVDKATARIFAVHGKAFYFSSKTTLDTFAKNPARYLHGG